MHIANSGTGAFTNHFTGKFMAIHTGSDSCVEHEGPSSKILKEFGAKYDVPLEQLLLGEFDKDSFVSSVQDNRVKNQDSLVLVKLHLLTPSTFKYTKTLEIKEEQKALDSKLKAKGTPFKAPAEMCMTFIATKHSLHRARYELEYAVNRYNDKAGTTITIDDYITTLNASTDSVDSNILHITNTAISQIVLALLGFEDSQLESVLDFLYLQHIKAHGLEAPLLAKHILTELPGDISKTDWRTKSFINAQYFSRWCNSWNESCRFEMLFGSVDLKVGEALVELFKVYRKGTLCVGVVNEGTYGGEGVCLYNLEEVAQDSIIRATQAYEAYRDAMMALKENNFFKNFRLKQKELKKVINLSLSNVERETSLICIQEPGKYGKYIAEVSIPNNVLLSWFNDEISNLDMIVQYLKKS